jgi:hypothetical protein
MRTAKRVRRSAAEGSERHRHKSIDVEIGGALSASAAASNVAYRDAARLLRSAFIDSPEHPLEPRSLRLTLLAVAVAPNLFEHPAIEGHDVVVVVEEQFRRAPGLDVRGCGIFTGNDPPAVEGAQLLESR